VDRPLCRRSHDDASHGGGRALETSSDAGRSAAIAEQDPQDLEKKGPIVLGYGRIEITDAKGLESLAR
jgi:hypothetical protein